MFSTLSTKKEGLKHAILIEQVLELLNQKDMTRREIFRKVSLNVGMNDITYILNVLTKRGFITSIGTRPLIFQITDEGKKYLKLMRKKDREVEQ